jgi:DNA repair exonuclease SbcCD ATPase subunit
MSGSKDANIDDVFRQMTEILEKALTRINEVEQHISKDLESIRRQLDAVGVLKDNIANLNNRIDSLSKKLTELSKSEPQELNRMMLKAISELDKRMQMFTVSEVLSRLESGQNYSPRLRTSAPVVAPVPTEKPKRKESVPPAEAPSIPASEPVPASQANADAVSETVGSDTPWRERMREKYGLKKKPGKV